MKQTFTFDYYGKQINVCLNKYSTLSGGNAYIEFDDNTVLTTVNYSREANSLPYFPLQVNFLEKFYAIGMIPGGFNKREGKPSEHAVLVSRAIDRTFRPLFDHDIRNELQIIHTLMSSSGCINNKILGIFATTIALHNSELPFEHFVGACEVGYLNNEFIINPDCKQRKMADFLLLVSGTQDKVNVIEFTGGQIDVKTVLIGVEKAIAAISKMIKIEKEIVAKIKIDKIQYAMSPSANTIKEIVTYLTKNYASFFTRYFSDKLNIKTRRQQLNEFLNSNFEKLAEKFELTGVELIHDAIQEIAKTHYQDQFFKTLKRVDGRSLKQLRPLSAEVDLLKRTHGSGLFARGNTQIMSVTTLGSLNEYQIIENTHFDENKYFFHQYNFMPFSTGEVRRLIPPNRREIGHGALAESALRQVVPPADEFPYVIRQVSEVLTSNGSTSQASICASSLSLMAAGVPIKNHIAGISIGLFIDKKNNSYLLTDIQGIEDHIGEMDFKVASTHKGICAIQLDTKIEGITYDIIEQSLYQACEANNEIIGVMNQAISEPRLYLSQFAPKYDQFMIDPSKIKLVIGSGGKVINQIIADHDNVKIDINDDGKIFLYHASLDTINATKQTILSIVKEPETNMIYEQVPIVSIQSFGLFVKLSQGNDGLIPKSFLLAKGIDIDKLKEYQKIDVKIISVERGKIKLDIINYNNLVTQEPRRVQSRPYNRDNSSKSYRGHKRDRSDGSKNARFKKPRTLKPNFKKTRSTGFKK